MKRWVVAAGVALSAFAAQAGCNFTWYHYGENRIRDLINDEIGYKVPDKFCPVAAEMEIVVMTDAMMLGTGCVGYSVAGIRKRGSKEVPAVRHSWLKQDTACRGIDTAQEMAKNSALRAVENVMYDLDEALKAVRAK